MFYKKGVLRNFTKFSLRPATLLKKRLGHRCFLVKFVKFLSTPFLQNISGQLLRNIDVLSIVYKENTFFILFTTKIFFEKVSCNAVLTEKQLFHLAKHVLF